MLCLARQWQEQHQRQLDGILLAGDLGFFPDESRLDKATKRFAKIDPEELGVSRYFRKPLPAERDAKVEQTLLGEPSRLSTVSCPIVWCHGNHEDFDELEKLVGSRDLSAVDYYDRFLYLRSGAVTELAGLKVGAVGGAPEVGNRGHDPRVYVNEDACIELATKQFDILLGHGGPRGLGGETDNWGSDLLRELIEASQPPYYFFAHHKKKVETKQIGVTKCHWLNDVAFPLTGGKPRGPVEPGCMGILEWNDECPEFQVVTDPWVFGVTAHSWRSL